MNTSLTSRILGSCFFVIPARRQGRLPPVWHRHEAPNPCEGSQPSQGSEVLAGWFGKRQVSGIAKRQRLSGSVQDSQRAKAGAADGKRGAVIYVTKDTQKNKRCKAILAGWVDTRSSAAGYRHGPSFRHSNITTTGKPVIPTTGIEPNKTAACSDKTSGELLSSRAISAAAVHDKRTVLKGVLRNLFG